MVVALIVLFILLNRLFCYSICLLLVLRVIAEKYLADIWTRSWQFCSYKTCLSSQYNTNFIYSRKSNKLTLAMYSY